MNSSLNITIDKPDFTSWLAALLSVSLVSLATYIFILQLESTREKIELQKIESSTLITKMEGNELIERLIKAVTPKGPAILISKSRRAEKLISLSNISKALGEKSYAAALEISYTLETSSNQESTSLQQELNQNIENLKKLSEQSSIINSELLALANTQEETRKEFINLKNEVIIFFGLDLSDETALTGQEKFYQNGVLASMPVIDGFPDDIPTLENFAELLNQNGGKITIENGVEPQQFFQEKLDQYKDRAFKISLAMDKNIEKIQKTTQLNLEKLQREKSQLAEITEILQKLALDFAKTHN